MMSLVQGPTALLVKEPATKFRFVWLQGLILSLPLFVVHEEAKGCLPESPGTLLVQCLFWEQDSGPLTPEPSTCLKPTGVWCSMVQLHPSRSLKNLGGAHTSLHCSAFIRGAVSGCRRELTETHSWQLCREWDSRSSQP